MITLLEQYKRAVTGPFIKSGLAVDYKITEYDDEVWVTFQGTCFPKGAMKWIDLLVDLDIRPNHGYANGFLVACESVNSEIAEKLEIYYKMMKPIIFAGFSLGGAMAAIYGTFTNARTITFGAPRVCWGLKKCPRKNITQYIINNDPIPNLAPALWGYYHPGKIIRLKSVKAPIFNVDLSKCSHMQYGNVLSDI